MKARIGDIIGIEVGSDGRYITALYTHHNKKYGALLRVFKHVYNKKPERAELEDLGSLAFSSFCPVQAELDKGWITVLGHTDIPNELREFPLFRSGLPNRDGIIETWWLWDGNQEWRVGNLTQEQQAYPMRRIMSSDVIARKARDGI